MDLSGNPRLDAACGSLLASCLASSTLPIVSLDLTSCDLGPVGVTVLARALATNRTLRSLNLTGNDIGIERPGWRVVAEAGFEVALEGKGTTSTAPASAQASSLSSSPSKLSSSPKSSDAKVPRGNMACEALAEALAVNCTLESLNLSRNRLSPPEIACLARGLCQNRRLRVLNLMHNSPLPEGERDGEAISTLFPCFVFTFSCTLHSFSPLFLTRVFVAASAFARSLYC